MALVPTIVIRLVATSRCTRRRWEEVVLCYAVHKMLPRAQNVPHVPQGNVFGALLFVLYAYCKNKNLSETPLRKLTGSRRESLPR